MTKITAKISGYLSDVTTEMRKVTWPKRKELVNNTVVTLLASVALALFIFGADRVISFILDIIYPG